MSDAHAHREMPYDGRDLRLLDAWQTLRSGWRMIAAITVTFAIAFVVLALVMTPIYRAETTVILVDSERGASGGSALLGQLGGLASLTGVNLSGLSGGTVRPRALLESRTLIEEFIRRNDLLPTLLVPTEEDQSRRSLWRGVEAFNRIYDVSEDTQTGLIELRIDWTDPQLAADWANQLVMLANDLLRQRDLADAQQNLEYLNQQLARTNVVELQQVIYSLIETEMKTLMLANVREEYAFSVVDPAVPPEVRSSPKRKQLVVLGTLLGIIFGVFLVAAQRFVRNIRAQEASLQRERDLS